MTRAELITALEAATGPSQELDIQIALALGWQARNMEPSGWYWIGHSGPTPKFTASIDAALTLVPEGWRWSLDWTQRPPYQDCGRADLYAPGSGIKPHDVPDVYAATPAIALCIASLKARA